MNLLIDAETPDFLSLKLSGTVTQRNVSPCDDPFESTIGSRSLARAVMLDTSDVAVLDSSGINWLLGVQRRVKESGGRFILHSPSLITRNVIRVLNMQTIFSLADNAAMAKQLVTGGANS